MLSLAGGRVFCFLSLISTVVIDLNVAAMCHISSRNSFWTELAFWKGAANCSANTAVCFLPRAQCVRKHSASQEMNPRSPFFGLDEYWVASSTYRETEIHFSPVNLCSSVNLLHKSSYNQQKKCMKLCKIFHASKKGLNGAFSTVLSSVLCDTLSATLTTALPACHPVASKAT